MIHVEISLCDTVCLSCVVINKTIEKSEGVDAYDTHISFNPFKFGSS